MGGPSNHRVALDGLDEHPDDLAQAILSPLAAQFVGEFAHNPPPSPQGSLADGTLSFTKPDDRPYYPDVR